MLRRASARACRRRTVPCVSDSEEQVQQPSFIITIPSGMSDGVSEVSTAADARLDPDVVRELQQRLRGIAEARLRARAASRNTFIR